VLVQEGYEVVLVNSNPATIMTDPDVATTTYIEPLLSGPVAQVIERERPTRCCRRSGPDGAQSVKPCTRTAPWSASGSN